MIAFGKTSYTIRNLISSRFFFCIFLKQFFRENLSNMHKIGKFFSIANFFFLLKFCSILFFWNSSIENCRKLFLSLSNKLYFYPFVDRFWCTCCFNHNELFYCFLNRWNIEIIITYSIFLDIQKLKYTSMKFFFFENFRVQLR